MLTTLNSLPEVGAVGGRLSKSRFEFANELRPALSHHLQPAVRHRLAEAALADAPALGCERILFRKIGCAFKKWKWFQAPV